MGNPCNTIPVKQPGGDWYYNPCDSDIPGNEAYGVAPSGPATEEAPKSTDGEVVCVWKKGIEDYYEKCKTRSASPDSDVSPYSRFFRKAGEVILDVLRALTPPEKSSIYMKRY